MSDRPISEQYRLVAKSWVDADAAANLLEECKSATLAQKITEKGDMPVNRAETLVKASQEWRDYMELMVDARKRANLLKVQLKYIEMQFAERQSAEATARAERRM